MEMNYGIILPILVEIPILFLTSMLIPREMSMVHMLLTITTTIHQITMEEVKPMHISSN